MTPDQTHLIISRENLSLVEAKPEVFPECVLNQDEFWFQNFEPEIVNTVETLHLIHSKEDGGNLNFNTNDIIFLNYLQTFNTIN